MKFSIKNQSIPLLSASRIKEATVLRSIAVVFSLFAVLVVAQNAHSGLENMNSGIRRMANVRVSIVELDEKGGQSGIVKLVGDCEFCGQEFRFSDQALLRTPFYDGPMDVAVLKQQQFARGTVKISVHLMKVSEIHYVKYEY